MAILVARLLDENIPIFIYRSLLDATYFSQTKLAAVTVFAIVGGFVMRWLHRYKPLLVTGLGIYLVFVVPFLVFYKGFA